MRKKVFIIHGWGGYPEEGWFPWLKRNLEAKGFEVFVPAMPHAKEPTIDDWVGEVSRSVGQPDHNTYFVAHSIGCQTVMRYLETPPLDKKVGGAVFVAGWFYLENLEEGEKPIAKPWLETPIDFARVKTVCNSFTVLLSDDDPYDALEANKKVFEEKLKAEVVIEHNKGHFSDDDGVKELPLALNAVLEISGGDQRGT